MTHDVPWLQQHGQFTYTELAKLRGLGWQVDVVDHFAVLHPLPDKLGITVETFQASADLLADMADEAQTAYVLVVKPDDADGYVVTNITPNKPGVKGETVSTEQLTGLQKVSCDVNVLDDTRCTTLWDTVQGGIVATKLDKAQAALDAARGEWDDRRAAVVEAWQEGQWARIDEINQRAGELADQIDVHNLIDREALDELQALREEALGLAVELGDPLDSIHCRPGPTGARAAAGSHRGRERDQDAVAVRRGGVTPPGGI
jgi:hypothetical protein